MKHLLKLPFINDLHKNLTQKNTLIQVILGPRQVGKTTTVLAYLEEQYKNKHHYVSADAVLNSSVSWLREQWLVAQKQEVLLVIDEIQKVDNWAEIIKMLWDESKKERKKTNCVLLGSSSLKIQQGLTESLTGRFQLIIAHHWNAHESEEGYGVPFKNFLKFGGYPGSYTFIGQKEWRSYVAASIVSTVIEKDILQFHSVKSPALFKQAFEILMAYPAREISYTKLLGQLQERGNVEVIKHYLSLYEGAYLIKALEKYSPSRIRIKSSSPKMIPLAPCFYYLTHLEEYSPEEKGYVFEAVVGSQLVRTGEEVYYWREGKYEVDFILQRGKTIWAIEVKSGRKKSTNGLSEFKKKHPNSKPVLITPENYLEFEQDPIEFLEK